MGEKCPIIPLLGIIFYLWILYTSGVKDRPLPNVSFYETISSTPDNGRKIDSNMS
jgi:hypothetical protein